MKKFLMAFALLIGLLSFQPNAHANPYPDYLNGDSDYVCTDGHMGTAWYMKKSSRRVEQDSPPIYVISVSVYTVNNADRGNTSYREVQTMRFRYDWDRRAMYVQSNNGWRYLDPNGSWAQTGVAMPTGEMVFYVASGEKFYGTFGYEFYRRAD